MVFSSKAEISYVKVPALGGLHLRDYKDRAVEKQQPLNEPRSDDAHSQNHNDVDAVPTK